MKSPIDKNTFLATSNGDLENIFIWDIKKKRDLKNILKRSEDVPDYYLNTYKGFEFENIRWSKNQYKIHSTLFDKKKNKTLFCTYDLDAILNTESVESNKQKNNVFFPNLKYEIPFKVNYFVMNDANENQFIGTGEGKKFLIDLRQPKDFKFFDNNNSEVIKNNEIIVEYNQENNIVFVDKLRNHIEIFDIRKEKEKILKIEFECIVKKIEFDPFKKEEFIVLFENYFVSINFSEVKYNSFWFGDKKLNDFSFNHQTEKEFLICGDTNNPENHIYPGYLNINKFNDS